ncbi:hypothetical protein P4571_08395 [Niallia alba]|uniref:hypothetical protein n=1 Tax=Niallia alba TaxID=2729105 RepID=UPI002E1FE141|nr:hypothetical protein [Niallia alba]
MKNITNVKGVIGKYYELIGKRDNVLKIIGRFIADSAMQSDIDKLTKEYKRLDEELNNFYAKYVTFSEEYFDHLGMIKKLYKVASKLDSAYCTSLHHNGEGSFTGEEYDGINDFLIEVEDYLNEKGL